MRGLACLLLIGCANATILDDVETDATPPPRDAAADTTIKNDASMNTDSAPGDAIADTSDDQPQATDAGDGGGGCGSQTKSPATAADDATLGTRAWSSPTNIFSSNMQHASISAMIKMEISHYLRASNFGFSVPNNMKITGVTLEVERKSLSAVGLVDHRVRIAKGGVIGATDKSSNVTWPQAQGKVSYGGANDTWGEMLTPADVNASSFGAAIAARYNSNAGNDWAYVDHVQVTVHYCP